MFPLSEIWRDHKFITTTQSHQLQTADVLAYGYAYEQQSMRRLEPQYLSNAEELVEIGKAM
jgi:hypothetical protein